MALTVSIAPAAQAPAARPARAAAPAASDSAGQFDAVLARTADRSAAASGRSRRVADGGDEVPEVSEQERDQTDENQNVAAGFETCVRFLPVPEAQPVAADDQPTPASELDEDTQAARLEPPVPALAPAHDVAPSSGLGLPEPASAGSTPMPTSTPIPTVVASVPPSPTTVAMASPSAGATARAERPELDGEPRIELRSGVESRDVIERLTEGPVEAPRPQAARPAPVNPGTAPRAEARALGQAIVADALGVAQAPGPDPTTAPPDRIATAPLQAPSAQASGASDATAAAPKNRALSTPIAVPAETADAVAQTSGHAQAGGREGGQPHGQDRGTQAAKALVSAAAAALPASMVFPSATFATALDRAMPMAQAGSPAFGGQAFDSVVPQIVRSLHMQVTSGGGDMTLTLTPEHLGTVTIELRVDQQRVSASLGADTAAVRGWIAAHEQDLKAGLADLGLQLDEFVVRDEDPRQRREQGDGQHAPQRRKRMKSDETVFEVQA